MISEEHYILGAKRLKNASWLSAKSGQNEKCMPCGGYFVEELVEPFVPSRDLNHFRMRCSGTVARGRLLA